MTPLPKVPLDDPAAWEALLREALAGAGRTPPFEVDVTARVMARVAELGPAPRSELGRGQLAGWAVAAAAAGVALLTGAAAHAPTVSQLVGAVGRTTAESAATATSVGARAGVTLAAFGHLAAGLAGAASALVSPLARLQPVAATLLTLVAAAVILVSTIVVGRDFRARAVPEE